MVRTDASAGETWILCLGTWERKAYFKVFCVYCLLIQRFDNCINNVPMNDFILSGDLFFSAF